MLGLRLDPGTEAGLTRIARREGRTSGAGGVNRASVVIAPARGNLTGKPRPYVIVQRANTLAESSTLSLCAITTVLVGEGPVRVSVPYTARNGLDEDSEVDIGRITTVRRTRIGKVIGHLADAEMRKVDAGLRIWLELQ